MRNHHGKQRKNLNWDPFRETGVAGKKGKRKQQGHTGKIKSALAITKTAQVAVQ